VWLCSIKGQYFALKQFPKLANQFDTSALVELQVQKRIKTVADSHAGMAHVGLLMDCVEDKKDVWLVYELCEGKNLNEALFEVKGEFYKGERIYEVKHS